MGGIPDSDGKGPGVTLGLMKTEKANGPFELIKIGLGVALLAALMGCVGAGYVDGGYGGAVIVPGPDVYVLGGGHERGRDVHAYSNRGVASRAAAHPGGGGPGGRR